MVSIGHGNEMLLSNELLEEEFGLIGNEEFILGSGDDQLGHVDESVVVDGILNVGDVLELGAGDLSSDSVGNVISKGKSPFSEASENTLQVGEHVLDGHDDGDDGLDSIDGSSQPGGPSSLGSSRDNEVLNDGDSEKTEGQ